jgi:hypothetical protein
MKRHTDPAGPDLNTVEKSVWEILTGQSWSFCKYLPESGIVIQGQVTLKPIEGEPDRIKWCEQGGWFGKHNKAYTCSLVHEYVFESDRILMYAGPDTKTLLHEFILKPFKKFPFLMKHTHICGQDKYACEWILRSETSFEVHYTVWGPKKNYHIQALYTANTPYKPDNA